MATVNQERTVYIMRHLDVFLGNDHESNNTIAVARQQILNKQQLSYNTRGNVENGASTRFVQMGYITRTPAEW
jgi:hypothetical protein